MCVCDIFVAFPSFGLDFPAPAASLAAAQPTPAASWRPGQSRGREPRGPRCGLGSKVGDQAQPNTQWLLRI